LSYRMVILVTNDYKLVGPSFTGGDFGICCVLLTSILSSKAFPICFSF